MKLSEQEEMTGKQENEKKPRKGFETNSLTVVLLGIIVVLLVVIFALLLTGPIRNRSSEQVNAVEEDIINYAKEQQENEPVNEADSGVIVVESSNLTANNDDGNTENSQTSVSGYKESYIMDDEDENDISYTKEYILNEMLPYFADNNLDAIWDLAHLKRYIKLSDGLVGTGTFYYQGDMDDAGKPHGRGLAIYESNSYYYGSWVHGLREGDGRWYRFYINEDDKITNNGIYQAHSYSGAWKNDLPNGSGAEHYDVDASRIGTDDIVISNIIGIFTDGLYDGDLYATSMEYNSNVREWYGAAKNGVFKYWRSVSGNGDCPVWQNRDDKNMYLNIKKSENKNQGIWELLEK